MFHFQDHFCALLVLSWEPTCLQVDAQDGARPRPRATKSLQEGPRGPPKGPRKAQKPSNKSRNNRVFTGFRENLISEQPGRAQERGPKKAQGRPSIRHKRTQLAEKPRQEHTSGDKTIEDETRGKRRQQTDKGLPEPLSPEPLRPHSTCFSCM